MHADQPAIDPRSVSWDRVRLGRYLVHQRFRYEYPERIRDLEHQLVVIPPQVFGDQSRTLYSVEVSEPGEVITRMDSFANTVLDVRIPLVERVIEFDAWSRPSGAGQPAPAQCLEAGFATRASSPRLPGQRQTWRSRRPHARCARAVRPGSRWRNA